MESMHKDPCICMSTVGLQLSISCLVTISIARVTSEIYTGVFLFSLCGFATVTGTVPHSFLLIMVSCFVPYLGIRLEPADLNDMFQRFSIFVFRYK